MNEERPPISDKIDVEKFKTIYGGPKEDWWKVISLQESFGRKRIVIYLFNKNSDDEWRRKQKYSIKNKGMWLQDKEVIEEFLDEL